MTPPLSCPVRGCGLRLQKGLRAWTCDRGHAFDIARSGYVNLLQPQDRRSADAGDSRDAVLARARLLEAGVGRGVLGSFVTRAARLLTDDSREVVELGCGSGDAIGLLHQGATIIGCGIDLSAFAVERAARRFPGVTWIVANADRRLPLADRSVALVLSLHARRNSSECARILRPGGHLLLGVPAREDLVELREAVQGTGVHRDRVEDAVAEHASAFDVIDRRQVEEQHDLAAAALRDLLKGTYRGERSREADRVRALDALRVTVASEVITLRKR